jgi:hypothetical protein
MSDKSHAMTDYLIAIGLHLNDLLSLSGVEAYFKRVSPQDSGYVAQHCTQILLEGLRSGALEPWEPIFKAKGQIIERWIGFWQDRGEPHPYLAALFFMRFQKHSPLPMDPVNRLIFLKIRGGKLENLEELIEHLLGTEGPRARDGVFAFQTLELARAIRRRRTS